MPYQYRREPLNDDEVDKLTNACDTFRENFVIWTLLDTGLRLSEFANLKKENIQWQEKRLVMYDKDGPFSKKTKRRIIPMTDIANVQGLSKEEIKYALKRGAIQRKTLWEKLFSD